MRPLADRYLAAVLEGFEECEHGRDLLPEVLARACVAVLPVAGAGLGLTEKLRVPLGASDDAVGRAERLQTTLGEGPCLSAIEAGEPLSADEPAMAARWPRYHHELRRQTPFRAVASLPLRVAGQPPVGALDLYSEDGAMDPGALAAEVQTGIADQISGLLLDAPLTSVDWTDSPVAAWLAGPAVADRMEVWKAVGMLMHTLGTTQRAGLALLRRYAVAQGSTLDAVAGRLTAQELEPADVVAVPVGPAGELPAEVSSLQGWRSRGSGHR
ncbi:GAF domain-containing protein [Microlunatus lacustris]